MNTNELSRIAELIGNDGEPQASVLVPDVRSGATFSYSGTGTTAQTLQFYLVVWIYTIEPSKRATFSVNVQALEATPGGAPGGALPDPSTGVTYRGTYSVSVSSASPDYEYRTYWGLTDLSKLAALNDHLRAAPPDLRNVLNLISPKPAMRTEIMGLTRISTPMMGGTNP
jgi:hypothetical protein